MIGPIAGPWQVTYPSGNVYEGEYDLVTGMKEGGMEMGVRYGVQATGPSPIPMGVSTGGNTRMTRNMVRSA